MGKIQETSDAMRAESFDLDSWIDEVVRPTVTVELYPREAEFQRRVAEIEAAIDAAEKVSADNRGVGDASPETLQASLDELRRERSASALAVEVRQLTRVEVAEAVKACEARGEGEPENEDLWIVSEATVKPHFTPGQLARLRARDISGESMVAQLMLAVSELQRGLPVPS